MSAQDDTFYRRGWARQPFRIVVHNRTGNVEWHPVIGWVNLSFGLRKTEMKTPLGVLSLASATHIPSGRRLLTAEELDDAALAAELVEPLLPEDDADASEWMDVGDRVHSRWREAGLVPSGVVDRFGRPIFHLGAQRLLRAVIRCEIEQRQTWGGPVPGEVAASIAASYPVLVTGIDQPALVQMLEDEFLEFIFDRAIANIVHKKWAAAGITEDIVNAKADELLQQTGGDKAKANKRLQRWLKNHERAAKAAQP